MKTMIDDVILFHKTFGHPILEHPGIPDPVRQVLRMKLFRDEYITEFVPAWDRCAAIHKAATVKHKLSDAEEITGALAEMGDVIADLIYYLIGHALEYGIPLQPIWEAVQQANMSKLWTYEEAENLPDGWRAVECPAGTRVLNEDRSRYAHYIVYDETGKVKKPPSWKEPDILGIIQKAMA